MDPIEEVVCHKLDLKSFKKGEYYDVEGRRRVFPKLAYFRPIILYFCIKS
jgi:hypothetical protein